MTYLVGYSPHKEDSCALALACQFARSESAAVLAVTVVPRGWETVAGSATDGDFEQWAAEEGEASAAEAAGRLAAYPDVTSSAVWVTGRSVPAAILDQAATLEASLIVVGSGIDGPEGRLTVTSKTDRLLHSSQVPVAIAPRGYQPADGSKVTRVTLAFRDDDATWKLLDDVAEICARIGAELRLLTVALKQRLMVSSGVRRNEELVYANLLDQVAAAQSEAVQHLAGKGVSATAVVARGSSWPEALASVEFSDGDVLVVGSSRTHPLANVFLGSSAAKILRNSTVPVIVVP
ncbi:universal stress protein [Micropruina sp.]|uniref:universal stress protein n=1 Tax=Micropruina sp. TaxID=2737536 RepID=UPI0039E5BD8A